MPTRTTTAPAATTTFTRDQVIELGRSGRPWAFLPVGLRALEIAPQDPGLRFLAAANLARLGLTTAAAEQLAAMPAAAAAGPEAAELRRAIGGLPADRIATAELVDTCRANVEVLARRGVDLRAEFQAWARAAGRLECYRANDGNIVRRLAGLWLGLSDQREAAEGYARENLDVAGENSFLPPYVLEGADPPWMLATLARRTPPTGIGYQPRISVLAADPRELLDGLALADLRDVLADPRVGVFAGPDAGRRLEADLRGRFEMEILGEFVRLPAVRTPVRPPVEQILGAVHADQRAEAERLSARVRRHYADRDADWWARRYEAARNGTEPPLRVLIPTTRFSTYIQHASRDLAAAFEQAGCETDLLIEEGTCDKFNAISYLGRLDRFRPDVVMLINYCRANTADLFPPQLPFVCWIQDAMWQQLDEGIGRMQSPRDFIVGHVWPELFERFGYPRRNALDMPMVVNARKFHDGAVDGRLLERHGCEIAYVSHQSEPPEAQRRRILAELVARPELHRCMEAMDPRIRRAVAEADRHPPAKRLPEIVADAMRDAGLEDDPRAVTRILRLWVLPLADRLIRHQSLEWAADLAERRGWRLRIHGRGWDRHPTLAKYAGPEIAHGEELRACYRAAAVHLHVTINTNRHQRVMECALSGGLPIRRRNVEDLWPIVDYTWSRLAREREPAIGWVANRKLGYAVADHPAAMALVAALQRFGRTPGAFIKLPQQEIERRRRDRGACLERDDAWLLGDPAETTFSSPAELEALVERAIERPAWRRDLSGAIARRVRTRYTTDHFAARVIDLVARSFQE